MTLTCLALAIAGWSVGAPAGSLPARDTARARGEDVVARVNGDAVRRSEFDRARANPLTLGELRRETGRAEPSPEQLDRAALRRVIHQRLLVQEGRRRGIAISNEELDDAIAALRRRFEDLRTFGTWLTEQGLDEESLFGAVHDDLLAGRAAASLAAGVRVSEEDVRAYHDDHRAELRRAEVRLQIIAVEDTWAAASAISALRAGESFSRVARRHSIGIRAERGGDTGWLSAGSLPPYLREAIADLEPGEARGPLQRGSEYLVVRLAGQRPGPTISVDAARPEIERRVLPQKRLQFVTDWLARREGTSRIELFGELAMLGVAR